MFTAHPYTGCAPLNSRMSASRSTLASTLAAATEAQVRSALIRNTTLSGAEARGEYAARGGRLNQS